MLAEGVEDFDTANAFKQAGADYVQGFAFSRPRNKLQAIELLRENLTN